MNFYNNALSIYNIFKASIKLDIYDLSYEMSSEKLNTLSSSLHFKMKGVIKRTFIYIFHLLSSMLNVLNIIEYPISMGAIIFFCGTKNEHDAVFPIQKKINNSFMVDIAGNNGFKIYWAYIIGLFFLPLVLIKYSHARGYKKKSMNYVFDHYLLLYGMYIYGNMWMKKIQPRCLVLSNHINVVNRVMRQIAKENNITTIYIQHASVPENFPPLDFDFALLEGRDALLKYNRVGYTKTVVFLIGIPKFDPHYEKINKYKCLNSIGICTSSIDPPRRIDELCERLRAEYSHIKIIIRPYGTNRSKYDWLKVIKKYNLDYSDWLNEISFDFLKKVDSIIAGESNIILEAALMNVFPIYYDYSNRNLDFYGFIKTGLVKYLSKPNEVCIELGNIFRLKPFIREKTKYYYNTVGTQYDGHSTDLASELILNIVSSNNIQYQNMSRIMDVDIEAYECSMPQR